MRKSMMWNFDKYADNTALIEDNGAVLTYRELSGECVSLYEHIRRRCLVFSMCSNTMGSMLGYAAFLQHGIVPVLLNAHMDSGFLRKLMDAYHPVFLWMPADMCRDGMFTDCKAVYESCGYVLLATGYEYEYPMYDELGLLLTTSGSTGSPKLVRQSYANIRTNAKQIAEYLELDASERPISTLPMNYTYGLSIINSHFLVGATLLLTEKTLMQREFWSFFKDARATSFGGVPYTYEMLDKLRFFRMNLPSLRYMTQAGGKLSPGLHKKFAEYAEEKGKKFIVMYGACEATARMGYLPAEKSLEKYGSCGIAIPGGKFYLIDENDCIIEDSGVTGELVYEGANVTMGYAECGDDLAKGDERGGILKTGDMAKRDSDGYYFIVGRKKRFLKIYGNRVNLDEIDRMVKAEFSGVECASTGVDDHMYIFITDESVADGIRKFLSEKTKLNPAAFKVMKIDEIPKNDAGKTLYNELEKYCRK